MASPRTHRPIRRAALVAAAGLTAALTLAYLDVNRPAPAREEAEARAALPPDLALVPADAFGFVHIQMTQLWETKAFPQMVQELARKDPDFRRDVEKHLGVPPESLAGITVFGLSPTDPRPVLVLRTRKPYDQAKVLAHLVPQARKHQDQGKTYYTSPQNRAAVYPATDQVFMTGAAADVAQALARRTQPRDGKGLRAALKKATGRHLLTAGYQLPGQWRAVVKTLLDQEAAHDSFEAIALYSLKPFLEMESVTVVLDSDKETNLKAELTFADPAKAKAAVWPARDLIGVGRMAARAGKEMVARQKDAAFLRPLLGDLEEALQTAAVSQIGPVVQLAFHAKADLEKLAEINRALVPAVQKVREAAARTQSQNNLKQIGIALHDYHDTYKKLPAPAIYDKNGKPLLSWRVAILPYIEEGELYKQFKLDEPWDSEHNKKLLAKIPKVYAPLVDKPKNPYATYYQAIVGPGAAWEPNMQFRIFDFQDGSSQTMLVAEAAAAVPWTKPDDIAYDPKKPLPRFGGLFPNGFNAVFGDGSVHFISRKISQKTLHALITRSGNDIVGADFE